jgi:ABC-type branched-subunit amino acid transport system substrate-binding protein
MVLAAVISVVVAACGSSSKKPAATGSNPTAKVPTTAAAGATSQYPPIPAGPIVFGVSAPLTGPSAAAGIATQNQFLRASVPAFQQESPTGIDGHPVKLDFQDDGSDPTKGVAAINQMLGDHVVAVITVSYSPEVAGQEYALLNKNKIPTLGVLSGSQFADTKAWPYNFGLAPSVQQEGQAAAQYIAKKGYTKVATLTDGLVQDVDALNQITNAMKTDAPQAKVVTAVTVTPGTVDMSTAVAQLKSNNPDLLLVYLGYGFGPLWQAIRSANWSPKIMATAGAWYDGFDAMGPLATTAVAPFYTCADSADQTFPPDLTSLFSLYAAQQKQVNYLISIDLDSNPFNMLKYAIEKYHSVDPNAIKTAIEGIHGAQFHYIPYDFSPTNHYGVSGQYGAAVCNMAPPYAGGPGRLPTKAS